jgi:hypothetical protein
MPAITLGGVTLPDDLQWTDEYAWSPVARASTYSLTGSLIIEEAAKQAGRPITLGGEHVWLHLSTLTALRVLADTPGWTGILVLADERQFTVAFRENGITAEPVFFESPSGAAEDQWRVTILLQTV